MKPPGTDRKRAIITEQSIRIPADLPLYTVPDYGMIREC
jgi:hypothetical protein